MGLGLMKKNGRSPTTKDHSEFGCMVSSFNENDSSDTDGSGSHGDSAGASNEIAKNESVSVRRLRWIVLVVILVATFSVTYAIYYFTSSSENDIFVTQFEGAAGKVLTSFEDIVERTISSVGSLAVQSSMYAANQKMTWPFVTMHDFPLRGATTGDLSGALFTRLIPVVSADNRKKWESYSVLESGWIQHAREYQEEQGLTFEGMYHRQRQLQANKEKNNDDSVVDFSGGIGDKIYGFDENYNPFPASHPGPYFPLWQEFPTFGRDMSNFDVLYYPAYAPYALMAYETGDACMGGLESGGPGNYTHPDLTTSYFSYLLSINAGKTVDYEGDPMSTIYIPVFDDFQHKNRTVVGVIFAVFKWAFYFQDLLPANFPGVVAVLENNCEGAFTYEIIGEKVMFRGQGDLHNPKFDHMKQSVNFENSAKRVGESLSIGIHLNQDICAYKISVYPSENLEKQYLTNQPGVVTGCVATVFLLTGFFFMVYNLHVERRQTIVMDQAVKSTAIVSSLFPEAVRDRLMGGDAMISGKSRLTSYLANGAAENDFDANQQVLADLFPFCTVFFADIAGFTAWSSSREPSSVFILLQTIYQAFDDIAKRNSVFKVETIGDSYVAVTGLPNPNEKHFINAAKFSFACLHTFNQLVQDMEVALGPDTADLKLRIGLHSGAVTAGVLRGDRSRFQLFGDTVNTAARMESTGVPGKIQCSQATATLLQAADKGHWTSKRENSVSAKGKGILETYWLQPEPRKGESSGSHSSDGTNCTIQQSQAETKALKRDRLVDWNVDILTNNLKKVVAKHKLLGTTPEIPSELVYHAPEGTTSIDEVADVIRLPKFDSRIVEVMTGKATDKIQLSNVVIAQLREVVSTIADFYVDNPFHNFEHACHVTMCVDKFLNRIVRPDVDVKASGVDDVAGLASHIHNYTHGINSDPLTHLAIVFAALIHDIDHRGVSNMQLAKEKPDLDRHYKSKSIAEQNSFDIAWSILMETKFAELRENMFATRTELMRFRQILVNMVLATDIFDKELNTLRKQRWDRAFSDDVDDELHDDLRATIVIEHIIQAADVSHTMQHWHIYRKWNERLFKEMMKAHKEGRLEKSPAEFWVTGELGFFDFYIIPLAKKLKDCNVFGVSSDECLNYASMNRAEWEARGNEVLKSMLENLDAASVIDDAENSSCARTSLCSSSDNDAHSSY